MLEKRLRSGATQHQEEIFDAAQSRPASAAARRSDAAHPAVA
jgi:hypothetical protein